MCETDQLETVTLQYVTVTRDDSVYECFPDMARAPNGGLVVVYRESEAHAGFEYTRLIVRRSDDEGASWGEKKVIIDGPHVDDPGPYLKYNCAKISTLSDGRMAIVCDENEFEPPDVHGGHKEILIWFSEDDGMTWSGPHRTGINLALPDSIIETTDGNLLVGGQVRSERTGKLTWHCCHSEDGGEHWSEPVTIADDGEFEHCEGTIIRLPRGELVCYMRENSHQGYPGYKCISEDGGYNWTGPYRTLMAGCERPQAGITDSGQILVTYRNNMRGARNGKQNMFAYLEGIDSALQPEREKQAGRIIAIDHDNHAHPDTGYSGWEQLEDGRFLCVYYIKKDAPNAFIRGRFFRESEF